MTTIHRCGAALAAFLATFTAALALASAASAQVPLRDADTSSSPVPAPAATQVVHDGAPMWLLIVVALGAVAATLVFVAAAPKFRTSYRAISAH